jgi:hypothetical protein
MHLDNILNLVIERSFQQGKLNEQTFKRLQDLKWSLDNFFISVWGTPQQQTPWAFKLEGHHLTINITVHQDRFAVTPFFVGTDPAQVPLTSYAGWRVLSKEEDYAFRLINSLSAGQKAKATISTKVPADIITNPQSSQRLTGYQGLAAKEFNKNQKKLLQQLIQEFTHNLEHDKAHQEYAKIVKAGFNKIYFGWIGSYVKGKPYYYVIHGPTFLIELDNANANHIHAIWRETGNDFGEDLLKNHYSGHKH